MSAATSAESEPEFLCEAPGTNSERRVPVEAHSVRGRFTKAGAWRIRSALPRGTQPPRQGQRSAVLMWQGADDEARTIDPMSRAPRRPSKVLLPKGRMSFLTIRHAERDPHPAGELPRKALPFERIRLVIVINVQMLSFFEVSLIDGFSAGRARDRRPRCGV